MCQAAKSQLKSENCNFFTVIPEEVLDGTNVDIYSHRNIFNVSQSEHRLARVRKRSSKKSSASKLFQYFQKMTQQRCLFQEGLKSSRRYFGSLLKSLRDFLKTFDQASKCLWIAFPDPNFVIASTKSKDNLLRHCYKDIIEHLKRQFQ